MALLTCPGKLGKVTNVAFVYKALSMYVGANPMLFVEIVKYAYQSLINSLFE